MLSNGKSVVIARVLLPAGRELLESGFEVTEGGLDSDRESLLELVPGAGAIVADPTVPSTSYVDLTIPRRPAVRATEDPADSPQVTTGESLEAP